MSRIVVIIIGSFLMIPSISLANILERNDISVSGLSSEQAKYLLKSVLLHNGENIKQIGVFIDGPYLNNKPAENKNEFFEFGLFYSSPKYGAIQPRGDFFVSRYTGDVWEITFCKHYSYKELNQIQSRIMSVTGKYFSDERLSRRKLGCTDD